MKGNIRHVTLYWLHTSDVHSSVFMYDYLKRKPTAGGLSAVYAFVQKLRREHPGHVICTDGGDCLQGQPLAYYYNFVDTESPHLITQCMNEMHYDAGIVGNHDIETGHAVYDRWIREVNYPILGANIIDETSGRTYLEPYQIIEREGVKIAILGMLTPAIPSWLPRSLWENLYFEDMVESTRFWVQEIRQKEQPHLIVGLFHSGLKHGIVTERYVENATQRVAEQVSGLDIIFYGHDHLYAINRFHNPEGKEVLTLGPTSMASRVALAEIHLTLMGNELQKTSIRPSVPIVDGRQEAEAILFEEEFRESRLRFESWISNPIGELACTLDERDAYFGPSLFIDFVHQLQLDITGADISFAAPLNFDSRLEKGTLTVSDMFSLYKYENFLYTMRMTGREIRGFLEMDYALWTSQMTSPQDHIMLLDDNLDNGRRKGLKNMAFNFESAAGIRYTVDVTKPEGEKISILSMMDGTPFSLDQEYMVAMNSYRGNGGGELMTRGAGIPHEELSSRIVSSTEKDLRYYFIERIREMGKVVPKCNENWRFIPSEWTIPACKRDRMILFPDEKKC